MTSHASFYGLMSAAGQKEDVDDQTRRWDRPFPRTGCNLNCAVILSRPRGVSLREPTSRFMNDVSRSGTQLRATVIVATSPVTTTFVPNGFDASPTRCRM